jgi:hypothetical protein
LESPKRVVGQQELREVDGLERNMSLLLCMRFLEAANLTKKKNTKLLRCTKKKELDIVHTVY